jgi:hypothetical protein
MPAPPAADEGQVTPHRISGRLHRGRALAPLLGAVLAALLLLPAGAGAVVVESEPGGVKAGVQPDSILLFPGATLKQGKPLYAEVPAYPEKFANPSGAPVVSSSHVYAIYWDPTDSYHGDWQNLIDTFFHNMGAESGSNLGVFSVDSQYTDRIGRHASYNTTFMGAVTDTEPYPAPTCVDPQPLIGTIWPGHEPAQITCLTDRQIRTQLQAFINEHFLAMGMKTIFYLLTPPGVTVCLNEAGGTKGRCSDFKEESVEGYEHSFCSYHSYINPNNAPEGDASTVLYSVIPWSAGNAGDGHLSETPMVPGYICQDGGFNPASKPIEQEEKAKEQSAKEIEEFEKATEEEKAKKTKEREREGPHQQEPNQPVTEVGPDGYFDTGLADLIVNQIAVEQQNTVTDPLLNAWQDTAGNEATDECRNWFASTKISGSVTATETAGAGTLSNQTLAGGNYYLNDAFNLAALKLPYPGVPCLPGIRVIPQFTAPNPVKSEEIVGFDGMESDISLGAGTAYNAAGAPTPTYAVYTWNFGDGSPPVTGYAPGQAPGNPPALLCAAPWLAPCAGSTFHSYKYGGTYEATLSVTDVGGNTATTSQKIVVVGPPPPPVVTPGKETPGSGGSGSGSGGSGSVPHGALPAPAVAEMPLASSLKQVARSGLLVRYTVNEQVTGRIEVLMEAAAAHRLGITGPAATGLPAGTPASIVIGRALVTTLKGGGSSVRIKLSKSAAKHLKRAHKVTLTVRMIVRNASPEAPLSTTVSSSVLLHR